MTKEQEEAIGIISKYLNFNEICGTRNFKEALATVLSMLKEKDKEIEKLKKENELAKEQLKKQCEVADERNDLLVKVQELQKENKEKDKQIDLMAEYIATLDIDEDICMNNKINSEWCNEDYTNCKECIEQYFERKCEE